MTICPSCESEPCLCEMQDFLDDLTFGYELVEVEDGAECECGCDICLCVLALEVVGGSLQ